MSDAQKCCNCKPNRRVVTVSLLSEKLTSRLTGKELKESMFMISGGRETVCGLSTGKKYVGLVDYQGEQFYINYKRILDRPVTRYEIIETDDLIIWHVKMGSSREIIVANIHCRKSEMEMLDAKQGGRNVRSFSGQTGYGQVKIYRREGQYCKLADDIEVKDVVCGFGVVEQ